MILQSHLSLLLQLQLSLLLQLQLSMLCSCRCQCCCSCSCQTVAAVAVVNVASVAVIDVAATDLMTDRYLPELVYKRKSNIYFEVVLEFELKPHPRTRPFGLDVIGFSRVLRCKYQICLTRGCQDMSS